MEQLSTGPRTKEMKSNRLMDPGVSELLHTRVLRELSAQLAKVNSVAELYNIMVRYNHQYCTAELLRDLQKNSRSRHEKMAIKEMRKYCEQLENRHEIRSREVEIHKKSSNATIIAESNKQLRTIVRRSNDHKTKCRAKKVTVQLPDPPPASIYYPRCATVKRCSGCCKNSLHTCIPEHDKIKRVKRKVLMIQKKSNSETAMFVKELRIEQHTSCRCACLMVNASSCGPLQEFNENNCSCKCRNDEAKKYCFHPRSWNPVECRCQCPLSLGCTSGRVYDEQTCKCVQLSSLQHPSWQKGFNQVVK
ncbi:vascular endothelial growth factor A-like [Anabrus simplex]|uniref:vascular endothelial growth factor A-like n=1 Tax=Anabrus simplex TaxID=316456 RepID=UPI0035A350A7